MFANVWDVRTNISGAWDATASVIADSMLFGETPVMTNMDQLLTSALPCADLP